MAGIYIHIPFCKSKCGYCDFFSVASLSKKTPVLQALRTETEQSRHYLDGESIGSLYFGGGTPSMLETSEVEELLEEIVRYHTLDSDCEITIEANPDDITAEKLKDYKAIGINRVSLGIQSFFESDLNYLDRRHDPAIAERALELVAGTGFNSFSADLIYAIPGQTELMLYQNLLKCLEYGTPHLSCYSLTVEPGTALKVKIDKGTRELPADETFLTHISCIEKVLEEEGYLHYEISSFAKPGHLSKHNTNYWRSVKYLGLGPSAHSFNNTSRRWNYASIGKYINGIAQGSGMEGEEILSSADIYNEWIMTRLRTMWGIDIGEFEETFGNEESQNLRNGAAIWLSRGMLTEHDGYLKLTSEGKPLADTIIASLLLVD